LDIFLFSAKLNDLVGKPLFPGSQIGKKVNQSLERAVEILITKINIMKPSDEGACPLLAAWERNPYTVKQEKTLDLAHDIWAVVYDLPPGPYQLPLSPFFRGEDPHLLEHIALKQRGQFETILLVCLDPVPALGRDKGGRGDNTFNAIGGQPVIKVKSPGACFVDNPHVIAFELRKDLLEGIIVCKCD
jgi:hypothetical protein